LSKVEFFNIVLLSCLSRRSNRHNLLALAHIEEVIILVIIIPKSLNVLLLGHHLYWRDGASIRPC
jgi:hypothetical protein